MTFPQYLIGMLSLAVVLASFVWSGSLFRAALFPGWTGAPARLVELIWAIAGLTVLAQILSVAGIFSVASLVIGALLWLGAVRFGLPLSAPRLSRAIDPGRPPREPVGRWALIVVAAALVFILAHWWTGIQGSWAEGMYSADTLWYHGPISARIASEGTSWPLHFTDTQYLNWFYPENSELQHAVGMVALDSDLLSPMINLVWLGIALLGAWTIGSRFGVGPLTLLAGAIVLDTGNMIPREAGTMANDVAPAALLLASGGILLSGSRAPGARSGSPQLSTALLFTIGLAAGLALGTKLTSLAVFVVLAVVLIAIAPRDTRWSTLGALLAGGLVTGGLWPLRDLILSGSPFPWIQELGPIDLPGPGRGLEGRDPYSVAHYIFVNPDGRVWGTWIFGGVRNVLGPLWALILGGAVAGSLLGILRPRLPVARAIAIAAAAGGVAYLFTPLTAAGPEGLPYSFTANFRYLVPVLCLGLCLLALEPRLTPPRARLPLTVGGFGALLITGLFSDSASSWSDSNTSLVAAVLFGLAITATVPLLVVAFRRSVALSVLAVGLIAVGGSAILWFASDDYQQNRYSRDYFSFQPDGAAVWAKPLSGERIAVAGSSGGFTQYTLYGDSLDNWVQYLGREAPGGDYRPIRNCEEMVEAINQGDYDYLVTTPTLDLNRPTELTASPERVWALRQPRLEEIRQDGLTSIFVVEGQLDSAACGGPAGRQPG